MDSDTGTQTKKCTKCGEEKPVGGFAKKGKKDGVQTYKPRCMECQRVLDREAAHRYRQRKGVRSHEQRRTDRKAREHQRAGRSPRQIAALDEATPCRRCGTFVIGAEKEWGTCAVCRIRRARKEFRTAARRDAAESGLKYCGECDEAKPLNAFTIATPDNLRGVLSRCCECAPESRTRTAESKYGLSPEAAQFLQAAPCTICGKPATDNPYGKSSIDHCHETGRVRGPLCANCNQGLGHFRDSPERLLSAIQYLARATDYRNA